MTNKIGHWVITEEDIHCSRCQTKAHLTPLGFFFAFAGISNVSEEYYEMSSYCPICGAKMEEAPVRERSEE
ncbi:MAG: hypothetical protein IKF29_00475 [Oceanobacillus sp.]|nr:hypothetical protein [Oceanobacillus sp.]